MQTLKKQTRAAAKISEVARITLPSPLGNIQLVADKKALLAVSWEDENISIPLAKSKTYPILEESARQLREYFERKRTRFDIPLYYEGTPFQRKVWEALMDVRFGTTATYGELARQLGSVALARAVGGALHRNPIAIIIPCHRIIGENGGLVGFAGGLKNKKTLLSLEKTGVS